MPLAPLLELPAPPVLGVAAPPVPAAGEPAPAVLTAPPLAVEGGSMLSDEQATPSAHTNHTPTSCARAMNAPETLRKVLSKMVGAAR